jgi:hypothetical protein
VVGEGSFGLDRAGQRENNLRRFRGGSHEQVSHHQEIHSAQPALDGLGQLPASQGIFAEHDGHLDSLFGDCGQQIRLGPGQIRHPRTEAGAARRVVENAG